MSYRNAFIARGLELAATRLAHIQIRPGGFGGSGTGISSPLRRVHRRLQAIGPDDRDVLKIELISDEALKTSAIEGEILDRDSVQSSLMQQFGLGPTIGASPRQSVGSRK